MFLLYRLSLVLCLVTNSTIFGVISKMKYRIYHKNKTKYKQKYQQVLYYSSPQKLHAPPPLQPLPPPTQKTYIHPSPIYLPWRLLECLISKETRQQTLSFSGFGGGGSLNKYSIGNENNGVYNLC